MGIWQFSEAVTVVQATKRMQEQYFWNARQPTNDR